jgi:hypothetical protein
LFFILGFITSYFNPIQVHKNMLEAALMSNIRFLSSQGSKQLGRQKVHVAITCGSVGCESLEGRERQLTWARQASRRRCMGSLLKDGWDCKFRARKDT